MTSVTMPQLGETVVEGTILRWLKKEGDRVEVDEPLFEISTDKVDTEVPSVASGRLAKILVPEGATVKVGTELAIIEEEGEAGASSTAAGPSPAEPARPTEAPAPAPTEPRSQIVSPVVRRLAAEHGIDLSQVPGTGAGGRVTRKDVLAYIAARGAAAPAAAPTPAAAAPPTVMATPTATAAEAPAAPTAPAAEEELVPISHIRARIAEHMKRSLEVSARAWTAVEVNMENVARLRERVKDAFRAREGFSLTYLPFIARAATEALLAFPMVNAELREDGILIKRYVNLGIAVSYEEGLIVPVLKGAHQMNLLGLARGINDLATRARAKELRPDEVHGGTFTITNPGSFGSLISVPIINQPQTAILSTDVVEKRPVVVDDAIAIRHMMYLSMSWDHRVIDGELATRFLVRVKRNLETWDFAEDLGL
ncbi:MAG: dihydrolipoamide acetyltransferase component of pyruvate dehydrogenase complex [Actinomycetota bacterium]|nr:MAG: dihydrolipoamide acetyltransferase component of pyruvate dehydrogenase complex [Actinomycetota bacterium]